MQSFTNVLKQPGLVKLNELQQDVVGKIRRRIGRQVFRALFLLAVYSGVLIGLDFTFDEKLSSADHSLLFWLWLNAGCVLFMVMLTAMRILIVRAQAGAYFKFLVISWAVNYCLLLFMLVMGYWSFWHNFRVSQTASEENTGTLTLRIIMFITLQLNLIASFYFIFWAFVLRKGLGFMKKIRLAVTKFKEDFKFDQLLTRIKELFFALSGDITDNIKLVLL